MALECKRSMCLCVILPHRALLWAALTFGMLRNVICFHVSVPLCVFPLSFWLVDLWGDKLFCVVNISLHDARRPSLSNSHYFEDLFCWMFMSILSFTIFCCNVHSCFMLFIVNGLSLLNMHVGAVTVHVCGWTYGVRIFCEKRMCVCPLFLSGNRMLHGPYVNKWQFHVCLLWSIFL